MKIYNNTVNTVLLYIFIRQIQSENVLNMSIQPEILMSKMNMSIIGPRCKWKNTEFINWREKKNYESFGI